MKSAFKSFQIVLLLCGVFGAEGDEVKSVMEGESVTLDAQIKTFNLLQWRFKNQVIAQIKNNAISYPNPMEMFRDRLQLDLTGSLTIKNMKIKHSGLYELEIIGTDGTLIPDEKFKVTVSESASEAGKAETKSLSLMEGESVTLQTDVTKPHGDELIVWRFGDEGKLIAKAHIEDKSSPLYYDERFRDRLKIDDQTGSLTITNTRTTDSGLYTVKISSSKQTSEQKYVVTISEPGLSAGTKAGIVIGVLLLAAAVGAAAVIYFRRKFSELQTQTLTVTEGEDVILKSTYKINKGDVMQWNFGDKQLQIHKDENQKTHVTYNRAPDGRFIGRLVLDETTGSLTIKNSTTAHSGLYKLKITSSRGKTSKQRFAVTVIENVVEISVEYGGSVTLNPDTGMKENHQFQWIFGDQYRIIAQISEGTGKTDDDDETFKGRLELNETTGSLTIKNIKAEHIGLYKLLSFSSKGGMLWKKFWVFKQINPENESATVEMQPLNR